MWVWVRTCTQICTNCIIHALRYYFCFYRLHNIMKSIQIIWAQILSCDSDLSLLPPFSTLHIRIISSSYTFDCQHEFGLDQVLFSTYHIIHGFGLFLLDTIMKLIQNIWTQILSCDRLTVNDLSLLPPFSTLDLWIRLELEWHAVGSRNISKPSSRVWLPTHWRIFHAPWYIFLSFSK